MKNMGYLQAANRKCNIFELFEYVQNILKKFRN